MTIRQVQCCDISAKGDQLEIQNHYISDIAIVGRAVAYESEGVRDEILINDESGVIRVLFFKKDKGVAALQLRDF